MDDFAISFQAAFDKAVSTKDGGWKLTLETHDEAIKELFQLAGKQHTVFQVAMIPVPDSSS